MRRLLWQVTCALLWVHAGAYAADVNEIFTRGEAKWADLQADTGAGTVAAANMLGISGDGVATVESVKGLVTSLKGLGAGGGKGTFAVGITPARTSFVPMDLSTYAGQRPTLNGTLARILGSTGIGYAQGSTTLNGAEFNRRAVSLQTSWYLRPSDDPVLALAAAVRDEQGEACKFVLTAEPPEGSGKPQGPTSATPTANMSTSEADGAVTTTARPPKEVDPASAKERFDACRKSVADSLKWNRSMASISVSRGWIRRADGSAPEASMGTAWTANITLGFDPKSSFLDGGLALTLGHRQTRGEPVLATLTQASPRLQNTSLSLIRIAGGGNKSRVFLEASNAKSGPVSESQRTFKRALGLDMQLMPDVWLNFRVGRQNALTGGRLETASLLGLSWSPKALMDIGSGK